MFEKAVRKKSKLRLLLEGASGSGKTYSALLLAKGLGGKIAVIDTEKGSASLYTDLVGFDVLNMEPPFTPEKYINAIKYAQTQDYSVLIIDSISHEWSGEGGCLDIQTKLGGRYQDWSKVTPRHTAFINSIIQSNLHIIGTVRTKSDHLIDTSEGKMKITKVGTKAEQRDGLEFEFTTVLRLNQNNVYEASKDRTGLFTNTSGLIRVETAQQLLKWLDTGDFDLIEEKLNALKRDILNIENLNDLKDFWDSLNDLEKKDLFEAKEETKQKLLSQAQQETVETVIE